MSRNFLLIALFFTSALYSQDFLELLNHKVPEILESCPGYENQSLKVLTLENGGPSFINSVYLIRLDDGKELIIKVGNPIWKGSKTENEVSALQFLAKNSSLPVPQVITYHSDKDLSLIEKEFIIMSRMPGKPLSHEINKIYQDKAVYHKILDQLAAAVAELKSFQFSKIGNFSTINDELVICGIVDFAGYELPEACAAYSEYAKHALKFYVKEMEILLKKNSPDSEIYKKYIPLIQNLITNVDFRFLDDANSFYFSHQDFVMKNILVKGEIVTALLDWEWSGSALMEIESLTGFDFLFNEEDKAYFEDQLMKRGICHFFNPPSPKRQVFYTILGEVYTLVAFREWQEGKLEHTAKFLSQKLEQRMIRNDPDFDIEAFIETVMEDLDKSIDALLTNHTYRTFLKPH